MKALRAAAAWLGSDWRLPVLSIAIVVLIFFFSGGVYDFAVATYQAYLAQQHAEDQTTAEEKMIRDYDEFLRRQSIKLVGAS